MSRIWASSPTAWRGPTSPVLQWRCQAHQGHVQKAHPEAPGCTRRTAAGPVSSSIALGECHGVAVWYYDADMAADEDLDEEDMDLARTGGPDLAPWGALVPRKSGAPFRSRARGENNERRGAEGGGSVPF